MLLFLIGRVFVCDWYLMRLALISALCAVYLYICAQINQLWCTLCYNTTYSTTHTMILIMTMHTVPMSFHGSWWRMAEVFTRSIAVFSSSTTWSSVQLLRERENRQSKSWRAQRGHGECRVQRWRWKSVITIISPISLSPLPQNNILPQLLCLLYYAIITKPTNLA